MTFSGKIGPSFDSYGHSYVKNDQKVFLPWISTSDLSREFPDREIPGKSLKFDSREWKAISREFPGMKRVKIALKVL